MPVLSKEKWQGVLMALLAGAAAIAIGALYASGSADSISQDRQPLDFRHDLHAGQLDIACVYCHRYGDQSHTAGIPSVHLCMTCHDAMTTQSSHITKLKNHWQNRTPPRWRRLQRLPDHVYFPHNVHLRTGLGCEDCHGRVDQIAHTPRTPAFEMGWCLTCHQQRGASQDCWTCHQ